MANYHQKKITLYHEVKKLNKATVIKLALSAVIAVVVMLTVLRITSKIPENTQLCVKCHSNITFNNQCRMNSQDNMPCIKCHLHRNGGTKKLIVAIKDEYCTADSCHPLTTISTDVEHGKNVKSFQHTSHMKAFDTKLEMQCISCHTNLGGEKHFETERKNCNICHFIGIRDVLNSSDMESGSQCTVCHTSIDREIQIYQKTINHELFEDKVHVVCSDCHFSVIQGTGKADKEKCLSCHHEISDKYDDASEMHYQHIIKEKTLCTACHNTITHGWPDENDRIKERIHKNKKKESEFKTQIMIFEGTGGIGIQGTPDPMYLATVNCVACHKDPLFTVVDPQVCNNCHDKGFEKILNEQISFVKFQMQLLEELLNTLQNTIDNEENQIIEDAKRNYNLIKSDGSFGVHNIKYVKELLLHSIKQVKGLI